MQLTTGQGGFQKVAGIDAPFGCPGADHRVNLVQEQDHLAVGLLDLVDHGFEAFFELASEFGPGDQCAHIQSQHPAAL